MHWTVRQMGNFGCSWIVSLGMVFEVILSQPPQANQEYYAPTSKVLTLGRELGNQFRTGTFKLHVAY